ncbi:hypothetical protein QT990_17360 [Microcoleus sp. T3_B1]|uniref:hypothetical protein n=1 Tax=Microcoleus sp. T3_B1 TaxID=3055425 RepID=UPI002FD2BBBD
MPNWPDNNNIQSTGDGRYYKVATDADHILVGNTENDIKYGEDKNSQTHAHYIKENGQWYVTNRQGRQHQEIVASYGRQKYGESVYGTPGASVDEGVSSWLDGLLR